MHPLLILIIAFMLLEFAVSSVLSWLNGKWMTHPIPKVLEGIYDEEKYQKQQAYMRANKRVGWIERCVSLIITLALVISGVLGWLDTLTTQWSHSQLLQLLIFFGIFMVVSTIVSIPFSYYDTFVIEEKFGFNKTTHKTFWLDALKSFLLTLVLGGILLSIIFILYSYLGKSFWIWATLVCAAFIIFFSLFYSNLIVPLFNKQKPLEEGELRTAIENAAQEMGFSIKNIYVINGSKHSTKANAYFTGFGTKKRVVLYDTLIEQLTTEEIVAVLAHELGHNKHRDTIKTMIMSIVMVAVNLFVFSLLADNPELSHALGGTRDNSFALTLIAFSLLFSPIDLVIEPIINNVSRRCEYAADAFAAKYGHGEHLISGLKKLSANTLSNLTPHPAVVWMDYSHPPLAQRIEAIYASHKERES
ncbi:MAG: M48 family metallopeptidase [Muribaculaceae bacterium]|nr:M48 family metallopeptidase [Muribaculaceae bacterium]